jgi:hypothetical protein
LSADRILRVLDDDDASWRFAKIRAFEIIFALILVTEYWARAIPKWDGLTQLYTVSLAVVSVLSLAALTMRARTIAFAGLALTQAVVLWREFPAAGNHAYLELVFCLLCALLDPRQAEEQKLFLRAARAIVCIVLFYGGVQKMVHGYYSHGQYLAFSIGASPSFRGLLEHLMPAAELERLAAYKGEIGDGPYLVASGLFVALSRAVYLAEMALAVLLVVPATRRLGVWGATLFVVAIEIGAREVFFGLVFVNALLLFLRTDLNRKLIGAFAALLAALLLIRVGVLPEVVFY